MAAKAWRPPKFVKKQQNKNNQKNQQKTIARNKKKRGAHQRIFKAFPGDVRAIFGNFCWPPRAPGWPETDSPRKTIANSRVETRIRALRTHFVAIFRFAGEAKGRTGRAH